ncbi:hypothetical protein BT93_L4756 [Corymbia citriodora subsp. variegata]|uniref:FAD dependent oxidoreductase domain-containing protein n=1 Tax=Corymbia citriodora subsp. variegata TaxID=360336 RepID=A0A8T0CFL3_CORYI|nr:hypothetical protein BT93_L4756 [Corymbia citriodora subsp. variegata]
MGDADRAPRTVVIVGAGAFGLATALALLDRPSFKDARITILEAATILPNPVGSSVDSSRIIRADYSHISYARLATEAQTHWRDTSDSGWGGQQRYSETGFLLTANPNADNYVQSSLRNVQSLAERGLEIDASKIRTFDSPDSICKGARLPGCSGQTGYLNLNSGWASADHCITHALHLLKTHPEGHRVELVTGTRIADLRYNSTTGQCVGVSLADQSDISADLTILATGAWTPSIYRLQNRALATGQVIGYIRITQEEQDYLQDSPVVMNLSTGLFIVPPRDCELKVARHGYGYRSFISDHNPGQSISIPCAGYQALPEEAEKALRDCFEAWFPKTLPDTFDGPKTLHDISTRPWTQTRICWYTDTPSGNFMIDYPPLPTLPQNKNTSLFLATGGSGHGFKFLPVLGKYIVDAVEGNLDDEYRELWQWKEHEDTDFLKNKHGEFVGCADGSRAGKLGMILEDELKNSMQIA